MEKKRMETVVVVVVVMVAVFGAVSPVMGHLPPGVCIDHCLRECKLSGIDIGACIKYCPVHCLPPDNSVQEHYCNLGCMLNECAQFIDDDKKMTDCVSKCRKYHCNIDV